MIKRAIISGGGTGGHIFPAIAIANEIKARNPEAEILFIGAQGKMEMERVPKAGYKIIGLDIRGFQRKKILPNLLLPYRILSSLIKARKIIKNFKPDVVVGVGGYASGPTLQMANLLKVHTVIQEQNSFAGKTNLILSKKAKSICVAYEGMHKFFPADKIVLTGNPVRKEIVSIGRDQIEAKKKLGFNEKEPLILVLGGSLGARTINRAFQNGMPHFQRGTIQVLWQTGKFYFDELSKDKNITETKNVHITAFIDDMNLAYEAADIIVSRAGALSVSELCLVGKPCILVPSPNVAEDHQTKNAMALVHNKAAVMVRDKDAAHELMDQTLLLLADEKQLKKLSKNILTLAKPRATEDIVDQIEKASHA